MIFTFFVPLVFAITKFSDSDSELEVRSTVSITLKNKVQLYKSVKTYFSQAKLTRFGL